jgi:hypothetical protein
MTNVAKLLSRRLELPVKYPAVGWAQLVNIQAPKERTWARNERALDLLTKCLEVAIHFFSIAANLNCV